MTSTVAAKPAAAGLQRVRADVASFVASQKKPGDHGFVRPAEDEDGKMKVMLPEMLVGLLLVRALSPVVARAHARDGGGTRARPRDRAADVARP